MSFIPEGTTLPSLATPGTSPDQPSDEAGRLSIAEATSRYEYTGPLKSDNAEDERHERSLAAQWIRQLVACYPTEARSSLVDPITPDTLIPVIYWSTISTYLNGTEKIDRVPLWMLACGEDAFLRRYVSTPPDHVDPATTILGNERTPYLWHMKIFWGDGRSAESLSAETRTHLEDAVPPQVLDALAGFNDDLLAAIRQGMPANYSGFDSLEVEMDCGWLEQNLRQAPTGASTRSELRRRTADVEALGPISLLSDGSAFRAHQFAGQWLSERGLSSDAQVRVDYQEVETIDSEPERKSAWVPLCDVVTQDFLTAYQSKAVSYPGADSARQGWRYPHRSHMSVDFSSLKVNGRALSSDLLKQLQAGVPPGYRGTGEPLVTEVGAQGNPLSAQEKAQDRLLQLLWRHWAKLVRWASAVPTFDTVLKNLLVRRLKTTFEAHQFKASLLTVVDPDLWFVNRFASDANGVRSLASSRSFTEELSDCLRHDAPPNYSMGEVGFFTRPDTVEEADSIFAAPVDTAVLRSMESVFYIDQSVANASLRQQLRDDLAGFRHGATGGELLDPPQTSATAETALAHLLADRFLHLLNLYRADQTPSNRLTRNERNRRSEEERLLDLITTHPSTQARSRLLRMPVPEVYAVMHETDSTALRKWPAAMVIKVPDQRFLFLYSLETGIQRFDSFQALVREVRPVFEGQTRAIRDISTPLSGHAFEMAADDLLDMQLSALETVLKATESQAPTLRTFKGKVAAALDLPMLSFIGPLVVRQQALVERNRPNFYKTATAGAKDRYRFLEHQALQATFDTVDSFPTLWEFTRRKIKEYLKAKLHPGINPDPDKTLVTLSFGDPDSVHSRTTSLTQLMLDNLRPDQYPNAMREVQAVYLADEKGRRLRNPANGYFYMLTGPDLAGMAQSIDAGGSYDTLLRETTNTPDYKTAWQAAYLANLRFKGYEAALRGDEVFKEVVHDPAFSPPKPSKRVALWLDAVLHSPLVQTRRQVMGATVHVHGLVLGGSLGEGGTRSSGSVASIEGALVLSDQAGPAINGTVGVYFPDSPDGQDFREFADLGEGVGALLLREEWQAYFQSRISLVNPDEIKQILGQRGGRPLVQGRAVTGDFLEGFYQAHSRFLFAHADERSNSNRDVRLRTYIQLVPVVIEGVLDLITMLLIPGFRLVKQALEIIKLMRHTGLPIKHQVVDLIARVNRISYPGGSGLGSGVEVGSRGRASFPGVAAAPPDEVPGLPLETAVYNRYAVADRSVIKGQVADARGFYRTLLKDPATGSVTARPIYIRQPDGTVFRVHDHTRLNATEATLVDPATGLSIRNSAVMRSTVARMPDGEWRVVGYGWGGAKRQAGSSSTPDTSAAKVPALQPSGVSSQVRTPGSWDHEIMDLVPSIMTRLPSWPLERGLVIIDEIAASHAWSVRYTPGQVESIFPMNTHPGRMPNDIVLRRTTQNHYSLILRDHVVEIPADGDCFFNAVARGLNAGQAQHTFSVRQLRHAAADYIDQHPEISHFQVQHASARQQALLDNAPGLGSILDDSAMLDLTRIVQGAPNPYGVFQPVLDYLDRYANSVVRREFESLRPSLSRELPTEMIDLIGSYVVRRPLLGLMSSEALDSPQGRQAMQQFLVDLLPDVLDRRRAAELFDQENFYWTQMMLEYGVTFEQLPLTPRYIQYDASRHAHLSEDELEELLDGAMLVDDDALNAIRQRLDNDGIVWGESDLFDQFLYYAEVDRTVAALRSALSRLPALLRRAEILLRSRIILHHLGGLFPVEEFAHWIRNPALSDARLRIISRYADTRMSEVTESESIDIDWMRMFDDQNLERYFNHHQTFEEFARFMRSTPYLPDVPSNEIVIWLSPAGQPPSNTRVALLLDHPQIFQVLRRFSPEDARGAWYDLIGPHFSDAVIRQVLARSEALDSPSDFISALTASLDIDALAANQLIQNHFMIGVNRAQRYLYSFDFPMTGERSGQHTAMNFALYLAANKEVPDWAWQYARKGVTPESLERLTA